MGYGPIFQESFCASFGEFVFVFPPLLFLGHCNLCYRGKLQRKEVPTFVSNVSAPFTYKTGFMYSIPPPHPDIHGEYVPTTATGITTITDRVNPLALMTYLSLYGNTLFAKQKLVGSRQQKKFFFSKKEADSENASLVAAIEI